MKISKDFTITDKTLDKIFSIIAAIIGIALGLYLSNIIFY